MFLVSFIFNLESATYFWSAYLKIVFNLWKITFLIILFSFLTIFVLLEPKKKKKKKKKEVVNKLSTFVGLAAPAKQFEWLPFCFSFIPFLSLIA